MFKGDLALILRDVNSYNFEVFFDNVKNIKRNYSMRNGKLMGFHMDKRGTVFKFAPIKTFYYDGHQGLVFTVCGIDLHNCHIKIDCGRASEYTGKLPKPIGLYYPNHVIQDGDIDNSKITDFML
jgi:hypothetical protein